MGHTRARLLPVLSLPDTPLPSSNYPIYRIYGLLTRPQVLPALEFNTAPIVKKKNLTRPIF